jgi:hypothetical protein
MDFQDFVLKVFKIIFHEIIFLFCSYRHSPSR